jgi:hypothetical protein
MTRIVDVLTFKRLVFAVSIAPLAASLVFAAPQARPGLPAKVTLVPEFKKLGLSPQDQGHRDVCSLFAITGAADFEFARHGGEGTVPLSEEFLIYASHAASGTSGDQAMFFMAVHGLNNLGICKQSLMSYAPGPDPKRKPSAEALADARERGQRWKIHWIKRWDVERKLTEGEFGAIKRALADGHPTACGLRWPITAQGFEILTVPPADKVSDGHSILFVGYEDNATVPGGGTLTFRNSWGAKYGEDGYGKMSYAYARAYANDAVWLELERRGAEVPVQRFEGENAPVTAHEKCESNAQDMDDFGRPMWSKGKQLFCRAGKGGFVELGFDVRTEGKYRLRVLATAGPDFGIVSTMLNGKALGHAFNLYCGRVSPSGSLELGVHEFRAGRNRLRFIAENKDAASENFFFGIDAIDLLPAK